MLIYSIHSFLSKNRSVSFHFLFDKFIVKINELRLSFTIFEEIVLLKRCKILQKNTIQ